MPDTIRALAAGLCLLLATPETPAQPPVGKPPIQSWTMAEYGGNAQNWDVAQADDGLIYVGGGSSLLSFDGASWRNIATRDDGRVRDLAIDDAGRIWVASPSNFGYFEGDAQGELIYRSISDELPPAERNFGETRHVHFLGDTVYFNTIDRIYRWNGTTLDTLDKWDTVFRITLVAFDRYYAVVGSRLFDLTDLPENPAPVEKWRWAEGTKVTFFLPWHDGELLLGTYDEGLYRLTGGEQERFNNDPAVVESWPYRGVKLSDGSLLLSTINSGVFHFDREGQLQRWVNREAGLPVNPTTGIAVDHEGGVWLAQDSAISRVDLLGPAQVFDADLEVTGPRALIEYEGELLLGGLMGVAVLRAGGGAVDRAQSLNAPIQESFDLHGTADGVLVSGHQGVQLMRFDYAGLSTPFAEKLLDHSYAYTLTPSRFRDAVYVELDAGMGVLTRDADGWRGSGPLAEIGGRIGPVAEADDGTVWAGSGDGQFHRLTWDGDALIWRETLGAEAGVPPGNAHVFRIGGRLIFGTTDGAYRLSENDRQFALDPGFDHTPLGENRDIFRLEDLGNGRLLGVLGGVTDLWLGEVSQDARLSWRGPVLKELSTGSTDFFALERDQIWLPRLPNLLRVSPDIFAARKTAPSRLNLRRISYPDTGDILLAGSLSDPTIAPLPHRRDALRFEYALASYQAPARTEYRARLVGLDSQFSPWSSETRRDYTNLPGGEYSLEVEARNVQGQVFGSAPLTFTVDPPAYLSRPALAAYLVAVALALWLAGWLGQRRRQAALLARQEELEHEVKARTREVRRQARELRSLNEAQSRFFANVSHEFRTPLTLAKGPLEELASGRAGSLSEDAQQHVAMALRNTQTLQGLIGQILDMKRLEAGEMPVSITRDNLAPLIREGTVAFVNQAQKLGVNLVTDGISDPVEADYDPGHLQQVIRNLMSNAMKFSPAGGAITVTLTLTDGHVHLSVADEGPGISVEDQGRIFERYYQGDQTHASEPGTGIGLALVKDLVALHRGTISVFSEPGQGARFDVTFPDELPDLRQDPKPVVDPEAALPEPGGDDVPTILLVDDNEELRAFLTMRLSANYRILQAADGQQGLDVAQAETPDVIVSDVMMPVLDGLKMTAQLKSDPETDFIPILLLSAKTTRRDAVTGLEQGADDYLSKPFDTAELAARVAGLITSRRRLRALAKTEEPPRSAFLVKAHEVLDERLGDGDFGPREWAEALHMDRTTLYRQLKKETDQAPEDYLREERLKRAAELLRARAGNVSQVAMTVGFNSISYFSRRFKSRFGVSPAGYADSR
ncbi:MAG: ATP-binding protein [Pseudomonadota bacterium]